MVAVLSPLSERLDLWYVTSETSVAITEDQTTALVTSGFRDFRRFSGWIQMQWVGFVR